MDQRGLRADHFAIETKYYDGQVLYTKIWKLREAFDFVAESMELPHIKKITIKRKRDKEAFIKGKR